MNVKRAGQSIRLKSKKCTKSITNYRNSGKTADCPTFNPDETAYEKWRNDALLWKAITNLPKTKQGPTAYLVIRGSAKDQVFHMDMDKLKLKSGFDELIKLLDELYLPAQFENEYKHFDDLFQFVRKPDELVNNFSREWHAKLLNFESIAGKVSSKMAALMLLSASKLTKSQRQITKAMVGKDISYERIREVINVICEVEANTSDDVAITSETFLTRRDARGGGTYRSYGDNYRYRSNDRSVSGDGGESKFSNITQNGKVTRCRFCDSKYHYQRSCEDYKRIQEYKKKRDGRKDNVTNKSDDKDGESEFRPKFSY